VDFSIQNVFSSSLFFYSQLQTLSNKPTFEYLYLIQRFTIINSIDSHQSFTYKTLLQLVATFGLVNLWFFYFIIITRARNLFLSLLFCSLLIPFSLRLFVTSFLHYSAQFLNSIRFLPALSVQASSNLSR
jgi:hypothetical protein